MDDVASAQKNVGKAQGMLKSAGVLWFLIATIGQWIFVYYIAMYYGRKSLTGDYGTINDRGLISGYVDGDFIGNLLFLSHVLLAMVMIVGGTLQLTPPLRKRFPTLHRWTGRVFILIALTLAIGGYFMTWAQGVRLSDIGALGVSFNAHLIVVFAGLTLFYAIKRRIDVHRRWAMRLFIVANGVWFFRICLMGWYMMHQGPVGNTSQLDGPADIAISFACYLVPLAVLTLYQWASDSRSGLFKWSMAGVTLLGALATGFGVFAAYLMMWSPHF